MQFRTFQCKWKTPFGNLGHFLISPMILLHTSLAPYWWWWLGNCRLQHVFQDLFAVCFRIHFTLCYSSAWGVFLRDAPVWLKGIETNHNKIDQIHHHLLMLRLKMHILNDTSTTFLDCANFSLNFVDIFLTSGNVDLNETKVVFNLLKFHDH